ncbi:dTDP-4-amino-4,6-dideoxyglucose formyltransferase [uncultured Tenacibaculum sp.]|uniref:dTDP-4-amino-4,6-dideoxyglucose formyltransferase n=1 Tax=uncultured Tenacibaculum sp. TaxID=174713 RepID=UPI0026335914|nr:dTDP-4-amino-4,6-dideoxyglucose formyltransferase [uncultured Tenacibaculum sp.]
MTDNQEITKRFVREVIPLITRKVNFEFACSPFSSIDKVDEFNFRNIDLRDNKFIDELIETKDLIISIHCKQLFPSKLIEKVKCINVHPGYNPINRGWYPQVFAIINDVEIGATIHEIDEKLDNGNIISRSKVKKYSFDTSYTLYNRVVNEEIKILKENINFIVDNTYKSIKPEGKGNLYLKKDFNELCVLDLNEKCTMGEAINKLRALTHGSYKNAFFIDESNNKVYVSIDLTLK